MNAGIQPDKKNIEGWWHLFIKVQKLLLFYMIKQENLVLKKLKNYWIKEIKPFCSSETIIAIVGNKSHLYEREEVNENDAREYAKSINALFKLVSTREVFLVNDLFYEIGKRYIKIKGLSTVTKRTTTEKNPNPKLK